ncbi:hypothetical protein AMJ86_03565 [bacterium SM23_57]|nr:MAG: hypothetical protein AMJ86_03565 [bacterium SM23_57]
MDWIAGIIVAFLLTVGAWRILNAHITGDSIRLLKGLVIAFFYKLLLAAAAIIIIQTTDAMALTPFAIAMMAGYFVGLFALVMWAKKRIAQVEKAAETNPATQTGG